MKHFLKVKLSRVRFGKTIETAFDLSYLLIDFQDILWMSGFKI